VGIQVTIAASQIDKARLGYNGISLTNAAIGNTAEPSIAAGSKVEIGGALYEFTGDETCTGWAGLSASAISYILLTPSGASVAGSYTNTAPTWDAARQGWYTGTNRVVAMLYKDAASLYQFKNIIPAGQFPLTFTGEITSTVNPWLFNLPASSGTGRRIRITCTSIVNTGLVQIAPNGTDIIGSAGNVSCFLQNVDQSTYVYKFQFLDLVDIRSGYWAVVGGQLCPDQAVDTDGQQYHLGKLHHLPLGNTTSRNIIALGAPPALANWSAAITGAGVLGVPAAAKGLRLRMKISAAPTAAGTVDFAIALSDNNGNVPTIDTAHPIVQARSYLAAGPYTVGIAEEVDVPLNASGQFYTYTLTYTNATSAQITAAIVGFYMGD
jgi:hypothetical protein